MAKETKAERTVREAVERQVHHDQMRNSYLSRLLALLERAQAANFELTVKGGDFVLVDRDERDADSIVVSSTYEEGWDCGYTTLERHVEWKEEQKNEANRKFLAKQVALAKLSKEEKELLGL